MNNGTLKTWLKRETREHHHRVDQHPVLKPLLAPTLTTGEYARALSALYAPIAGLEQVLSTGLNAHHIEYAFTKRAGVLAADIQQLGRQEASPYVADAPANVASTIGMLYVLEGSRLGGVMIARHVTAVLGNQVPLRFLTAQPLHDEQWAAFWHLAEHYCEASAWPAVREGAQQAFGCFTQALAAFERLAPAPKV